MPWLPPTHKPRKAETKQHTTRTAPPRDREASRLMRCSDPRWKAIRAQHLAKHPLCVHCEEVGLVTAAAEVDHIDGDDSNNAPSNLQGLCKRHHSSKTCRENGGFGNRKRTGSR